MSLQVEQDTCTGRGFSATDATGFCAKFKTWVEKTPAAGGPGWTIIKDRSATPSAKTISSVNTSTEELTITGHGFYDGEPVYFANSGGALPTGLTAGTKYYAFYVDDNTIKVCTTWANWINRAFVNLTSTGSGTNTATMTGPYIVVSNDSSPAVQDNAKIMKIGYDSNLAGYVYIQFFFSKGWTSTCHPVGVWAGYYIKTVDSGSFTYNFRGGDDFMLIQSRPPAGGVWWRVGLDEFTPLANFLEDYATVGGTVASDAVYTPGVSETILTLTSSTDVDTLTKGQGYFLYYCGVPSSAGRFDVQYGIVSKKGVADGLLNTQIAFSFLTRPIVSGSPIYSGAKVTPYWHRFYTFANTLEEGTLSYRDFNERSTVTARSSLPYQSWNNDTTYMPYPHQDNTIQNYCRESTENEAIARGAQDNGAYVVMRPLLIDARVQSSTTTTLNRLWGEGKNLFISAPTGMTDMETGRTIEGIDHIYIGNENTMFAAYSASNAVLVPHTESV